MKKKCVLWSLLFFLTSYFLHCFPLLLLSSSDSYVEAYGKVENDRIETYWRCFNKAYKQALCWSLRGRHLLSPAVHLVLWFCPPDFSFSICTQEEKRSCDAYRATLSARVALWEESWVLAWDSQRGFQESLGILLYLRIYLTLSMCRVFGLI